MNLVLNYLYFSCRFQTIFIIVNIFILCQNLNCKIRKEFFDLTFWFAIVMVRTCALINVYIYLSHSHIESIILQIKTCIWKISTNNSKTIPGIEIVNIYLIKAKIALSTPFDWYSFGSRIETYIKIKGLLFEINVCILKYVFNWRINVNIGSINPCKEFDSSLIYHNLTKRCLWYFL